METANLSWYFNHEYYDEWFSEGDLDPDVDKRNRLLRHVKPHIPTAFVPNEHIVDLQVEYPGLLVGIGYQHATAKKGEFGLGFSLDYVTGLPYLPGSSVKGVLRAAFAHRGYIHELLSLKNDAEVDELELAIFGSKPMGSKISLGEDVFLDAFPICGDKDGFLLEVDAITPHSDELETPVPLIMLKVRPGVVMRFRFLLKDTNQPFVSADKKLELFRQILLDLGAGAKTNVGYGRFTAVIDPPLEEGL